MEREALKLALETFESMNHDDSIFKGEFDGEIAVIKKALAQPAQDLSEQGRNRSAVLGNNVEAMMDAGLPFLKALETTLKVYDHDVPKLGCVNHDCDKCKAQPAQEPVAGTKTWFEDGKVVTQYLTAKDIYKEPAQEPVAFAGIEIWVGNARIAKYLTQTELHYARDPWMLMQYSAEMCISKLKDKNNG